MKGELAVTADPRMDQTGEDLACLSVSRKTRHLTVSRLAGGMLIVIPVVTYWKCL